jgi:hypothetical protein
MTRPPADPKVYHITHVENLPVIIANGGLWSDRERIDQGLNVNTVGLNDIKSRRLNNLGVGCHPGTTVGEYVPFYLCPRSVMLSVFWYDNLPELTYHGGQEPIVHLCSSANNCMAWAQQQNVRYAFSDMNAGMATAEFFNQIADLEKIDWTIVNSTNFSGDRKHKKASEFLMYRFFPWELVEYVGVFDENRASLAQAAIASHNHQPPVAVERNWYF